MHVKCANQLILNQFVLTDSNDLSNLLTFTDILPRISLDGTETSEDLKDFEVYLDEIKSPNLSKLTYLVPELDNFTFLCKLAL